MHHELDTSVIYNRWDNRYEPRITIASGDTVTLDMLDASGGQVHPDITQEAFAQFDKTKVHALTGPIAVSGAKPGDQLEIKILKYEHKGWAWTSMMPELGLLKDDFNEFFVHIWKLEGLQTKSMPGVTLDLRPFCGIIGVQREEDGEFRTRAPGPFGGNMDVKHLTEGAILYLPVFVAGGLLCAGDCHAAQGDGEVSINGMEAPMSVTFEINLIKNKPLAAPYVIAPGQLVSSRYEQKPFHVFVESGIEPRELCKIVVRRAIDYLVGRLGISRKQAYILCSVVLDLKVSQLVNEPTTTISGYLPEAIFDQPEV